MSEFNYWQIEMAIERMILAVFFLKEKQIFMASHRF